MAEKVLLKTSDGVEIVGVVNRAARPVGAALLLHMMPASKESWAAFSVLLNERGLTTLAIDLRGHGESRKWDGATLDYKTFGDEEHQAKKLDVEAASAWLQAAGFGPERLAVAGASIGANLAMRFAAAHPEIKRCLALSPGLQYRGVTADDAVRGLRAGQRLLLAASQEDDYSYASIEQLVKMETAAEVEDRRLADAGHGTTMFERDPAFMKEAAAWLAETYAS